MRKPSYADAVDATDDDDVLAQARADLMAMIASAPPAPAPSVVSNGLPKAMLASQLLAMLVCFDAVPEMVQALERTGALRA